MDETRSSKSKIIVTLVLLAILALGYFAYNLKNETAPAADYEGFYQELEKKNSAFAQAESLLKLKKYDEAVTQYNQALSEADGYKEEGQVKYKIALALLMGNKPLEAVPVFKEVAGNENYTDTIRAYSVQQLGSMLYSYNSEEVKQAVFSGDPYQSFLVGNSYADARIKLFEYGSSIYPLGIPELRIAKGYSTKIVALSKKDVLTAEEKQDLEKYINIVKQRIASADEYLLMVMSDEQAKVYVPEVWYRKGNVLGDVMLSGIPDFPDPEFAYRKALELSSGNLSQEAAASYSYAVYLSKMHGPERSEAIATLLQKFTDGTYADTGTARMIKNEKNDVIGNKASILGLAELNQNFKGYLIYLGWEL